MTLDLGFRHLATAMFAALLVGCGCGEYDPKASRDFDLTSKVPNASYVSQTTPKRYLHCDAQKNCTLTFPDAADSSTTWTVHFVLDSINTTKQSRMRELR